MSIELDQQVVDPYVFTDIFDLEEPISYHLQWSLSFSLQGPPWGYKVVPFVPDMGNFSCSTSQGWFVTNFSLHLNGKLSHVSTMSFEVPWDPTGWGFAGVYEPGLGEKGHVNFTDMHSGENNLTLNCHLYSIIERAGKANMKMEIGPLTVNITGIRGTDGIPDVVQPFPGVNAYFLTLISGILFLPVAEAIRYYGKRIIRQLKSF